MLLERKLLDADNVFVVCEFNRQFLRSLYPESYPLIEGKVHLHHLGLNLEEFSFQLDGRLPNRILAVGRLSKAKGFDDLLLAIRRLHQEGMMPEVEIIGDGPEREALQSLAKRERLSGHVIFRGWQGFSAVKSAMREATLLVHPSATLGDAVPTVIKEAQALGLPVIGTRVAGIPELLCDGSCGVLVEARDIAGLAEAIEQLLRNSDLRRTLAIAGRKFAEEKYDLWGNGRLLRSHLERGGASEEGAR